eukprot:1439026-Prymnesium_polylepis.1
MKRHGRRALVPQAAPDVAEPEEAAQDVPGAKTSNAPCVGSRRKQWAKLTDTTTDEEPHEPACEGDTRATRASEWGPDEYTELGASLLAAEETASQEPRSTPSDTPCVKSRHKRRAKVTVPTTVEEPCEPALYRGGAQTTRASERGPDEHAELSASLEALDGCISRLARNRRPEVIL